MTKNINEMEWYVTQQKIHDKIVSSLAEMDVLADEGAEDLDTDNIIEDAYNDVIMMYQRFNQYMMDGDINEKYTRAHFFEDMLVVQSIRLASVKYGFEIEMTPIYDNDDPEEGI